MDPLEALIDPYIYVPLAAIILLGIAYAYWSWRIKPEKGPNQARDRVIKGGYVLIMVLGFIFFWWTLLQYRNDPSPITRNDIYETALAAAGIAFIVAWNGLLWGISLLRKNR
jgi:protein-S-isoprenylcysteine O-methyltransferase Ste14